MHRTAHPRRASAEAAAAPMPWLAPVTSAVCAVIATLRNSGDPGRIMTGAERKVLVARPQPACSLASGPPVGARGIGEIGITGVGAAVADAIYHATGTRVRDLPITLDKLL